MIPRFAGIVRPQREVGTTTVTRWRQSRDRSGSRPEHPILLTLENPRKQPDCWGEATLIADAPASGLGYADSEILHSVTDTTHETITAGPLS